MKIIHPNGSGGIAVLHPTGELPIEEVARKDVPAGLPYLFTEVEDFPVDGTHNELGEPNMDKTFRGAWEADFSKPDGFGIGAAAWFAEKAEATEQA